MGVARVRARVAASKAPGSLDPRELDRGLLVDPRAVSHHSKGLVFVHAGALGHHLPLDAVRSI